MLGIKETQEKIARENLDYKDLIKAEDSNVREKNIPLAVLEETQPIPLPAIGWKKCYKDVSTTAATYCTVFALTSVGGFACALFMKKIDLENFEAAALVNAQRNAVTMLFTSPGYIVSSLVAQSLKGKKSRNEIARIQQAGWIINAFAFIPAAVVYSLSEQIFILLRQPKNVAKIAQPFFWGYMPGALATSLLVASLQFPSGLNKRVMLVLIDLATLGLSIGLTRLFALGAGKFPKLGMIGYGYAQSIAASVYLLLISLLLGIKKEFRKYHLYKLRWHWFSDIEKILKLGIASTAGVLGEIAIFIAFPLFAGAMGQTSLAAQGIISFYAGLILISTFSFFRTSLILIGGSFGGGRFKDIPRYACANLSLTIVVPLIGLILTSTIPNQLANAFLVGVPIPAINGTMMNSTDINGSFINNTVFAEMFKQDVYDKLQVAFPIAALGSLFDSIRMTLMGALIGLNEVKLPGIVNLLTQLFIILPLMYALGFHTSLGITGMQVAYAIGGFVLASFMSYYLYKWKPDQEHSAIQHTTIELHPTSDSKQADDSNFKIAQNKNTLATASLDDLIDLPALTSSSTQDNKKSWWNNGMSWFSIRGVNKNSSPSNIILSREVSIPKKLYYP